MKNKVTYLISKYYWIVYVAVLSISFTNALLYPEFVRRHLFIDSTIVYIFFVIVSFFHKIYKNKTNLYFDTIFNKLNILVLCLCLLLLIATNIIEAFTYTNFVFSKFHLHPKQLVYPFFVSLVELIFSLNLKYTKDKVGDGLKKIANTKILLLPFLILILINNFMGIFSKMQKDAKYLIQNPFAKKEEIMRFKVGDLFYNYSNFIIANTESKSKILLPPFPVYPWPQTGNLVYFRYFLYPRSLYSGKDFEPSVELTQMDYVLLAWGETPTTNEGVDHGWPKFDVPAEYVLFFQNNGSTLKVDGNYKYADYKNKEVWGIIKVKKL